MPRKSFVQLQADLTTSFPDNITGLITPAILRTYINNFLEAIRPAYGLLTRDTPNVQNLGTTDTPLVFESGSVSDVPDYTTTPATGTINRLAAGTTRLTFTTTIEGAVGRVVTASLYKNGAVTPWRVSGTLQGAGKPVDIVLVALQYDGAAAAYQMQVKADTAGTSTTFSNVDVIAETVPVNAY
jgi:hypothetical protein